MEKLTDRQQDILDTIKKEIAKNGFPPTVREIGAKVGLNSSATTFFHIKKLIEKGYLKQGNGKNRTLELLVPNEYLEKDEKVAAVPLLGKVQAGNPIEAIEMPDEYFDLPVGLLPKGKICYKMHNKPFKGVYGHNFFIEMMNKKGNYREIEEENKAKDAYNLEKLKMNIKKMLKSDKLFFKNNYSLEEIVKCPNLYFNND